MIIISRKVKRDDYIEVKTYFFGWIEFYRTASPSSTNIVGKALSNKAIVMN